MQKISADFRALALGFAAALLLSGAARAAEIRVIISGGMAEAYKELVPEFEKGDRPYRADRPRPIDGNHAECDSGPAGARRGR